MAGPEEKMGLTEEQVLKLDATVGQLFEEIKYRVHHLRSSGIESKEALPMFLKLTDTSERGTPNNDDVQDALAKFQSDYDKGAVHNEENDTRFNIHYLALQQAVLALRAVDQSLRTYNETPGSANATANYKQGDLTNILTTKVARTTGEFTGNQARFVELSSRKFSTTSDTMQQNIGVQLVLALENFDARQAQNAKGTEAGRLERAKNVAYSKFSEKRSDVLGYLDQKRSNIKSAGVPEGVPTKHEKELAKARRGTITNILALEQNSASFGEPRALPKQAQDLLAEIGNEQERATLLKKAKELVKILNQVDSEFEPGLAYEIFIAEERPNSNTTNEPYKEVTNADLVETMKTVAESYQRPPAVAEALSHAVFSAEPGEPAEDFQIAVSELAKLAADNKEANFEDFVNYTSHLNREITPVMQSSISTYLGARKNEAINAKEFLLDEFFENLKNDKIDPNIVFTQPNFFRILSDKQFSQLSEILISKVNKISLENFRLMLNMKNIGVEAPRRSYIPAEILDRLSATTGLSGRTLPQLTDEQSEVYAEYLQGLNRVIRFQKTGETQKEEMVIIGQQEEATLNTTTTSYSASFINANKEAVVFMLIAKNEVSKGNFNKDKFFEAYKRIRSDELAWGVENDPHILADDRNKQIEALNTYIDNAHGPDAINDERFIEALIKLNDPEQKQHAMARLRQLGGDEEAFESKINKANMQAMPAEESAITLDKGAIAGLNEKQVHKTYNYILENEAELRGQPRNEGAVNRSVFSLPGNSRFAEILEQLKDRLFSLALQSGQGDRIAGLKELANNKESMQILAEHANGGWHMGSAQSEKMLRPFQDGNITSESPAAKTALAYAEGRAMRSEKAMAQTPQAEPDANKATGTRPKH